MDWQLDWLRSERVSEVLFSIGYLGRQIRDHVGDGRHFGLRVRYVDEGRSLRGTAGALRLAIDQGLVGGAFFVLYGDSYLSVDLGEVERSWRESGELPALMTVFRNEGHWDRSNAVFERPRVVVYDKSRPEQHAGRMHWIDYGLSIVTAEVVRARVPSGGVADLADVFKTLAQEGRLAGYEARTRFYEVGSPAGLAALEEALRRKLARRSRTG